MEFEPVIGLEVHVQLQTRSKMFCGCNADYQNTAPNEHVCPICLGLPGVLPVINKAAVEMVVVTGLALNSTIAKHTKFDRKNYPYSDLMKGYQISQYDMPICSGGYLDIESGGSQKRIHLTRIHLEEDVAKLLHRPAGVSAAHTLVDVNRSGVALMEMVGEPDIRSPDEARDFLVELRSILRYLGVSAANMEEGNLRCDANISVRPKGSQELNSKVEVKNMNSFRAVHRALQYEFARQTNLVERGEPVPQETRGWVEAKDATVSQRSKEQAHDYRFFPEPDLPPLTIEPAWIARLGATIPELPTDKKRRFKTDLGLADYEADFLTANKDLANWFEATVAVKPLPKEALPQRTKLISNWMLGELSRLLKTTNSTISDVIVQPRHLSELLDLLEEGTLNSTLAKETFEEAFNTGRSPLEIAKQHGYSRVVDAQALEPIIDNVIAANDKAIQDYLGGKETAVRFLLGQVMKATQGQADPSIAEDMLKTLLQSLKEEK